MMRNLFGTLILVCLSFISSASFASAPPTVTTLSSNGETVVSIGLRLEFGDMVKPSIVGSVRRTETDTSNDVTGALAEIAIPISPDSNFVPSFKVMGIYGNTDVQGMAGLGFDFGKSQWLLGLGVQAGFVDGGINIKQDGTLSSYIGGSSYSGPPNRKVTTTP